MKKTITELLQAKEAVRKDDDAKREKQTLAWKEIIANPDNWEWCVKPSTYERFSTKEERSGAYIMRRVNPDLVASWKAKGPATWQTDDMDGNWLGMFYYRTHENILTYESGGHRILNDPMLCSDAEWAEILVGNIPAKYIR